MVEIKPFKAIRPRADLASKIASLPYDVVSRKEATEMSANNPYSYLHIDRSEVDLPSLENVYSAEVYEKARENLKLFQENRWLIKDKQTSLYIYELTFQEKIQTGLVVTTSVLDYLENNIKKHEFTRYDKEIDRINHMDATDANTSPVFLTYRDQAVIDEIIAHWKINQAPVYDFEGPYHTTHRVWIIDNKETIHSLAVEFSKNVPALYIADGHHRTASAVKLAQKRKEAGRLSESNQFFLSVLFPVNQLKIFDYNRLIKANIPANFINKLAEDFNIKKVSQSNRRPNEKYTLALYVNKQWYHLRAKPEILGAKLVDNLDASLAQNYIFAKHFKINNPREDDRLEFVGGIRGLNILEESVDNKEADFAIALFPTHKKDLLAVADAGETMPPKSTWFEPKLLSGLFIHDLESK